MLGPRSCSSLAALALSACGGATPEASAAPDQATVPLHVEGSRPFIDVTLRGAGGVRRTGRFIVDSGGGALLLAEPLAREIGLAWGETMREDGVDLARVKAPPEAFVGTFPLEIDAQRVVVVVGRDNALPSGVPVRADGMLPGHVLAKHHVVLDYPGGTFTIARAGVLKPKGDALPMPVGKRSGFPRTEFEVDGTTRGFLIDTGASFTIVSEVLLKEWGAAHSDWPRHPGAYGEAKTLGGMTLETMFVPAALWGTHALKDVGVTSQREGTFERYMSSMTAAPIVGSLAGNVLKSFRVELDYPNERLYLSKP